MSTAQYRLPGWQKRFGNALEADLSGTFTVTVGSADETNLLAAGALLVVAGKEATAPPAIQEAGGTALATGDVLKGNAKSTGTPGSGTAVVGFIEVDSAGRIFPPQATTVGQPAYVKGAVYFDTTANKLMVGGATAWETVTSS